MNRFLESDYEKVERHLHDAPTFVYAVLHKIIQGFVYGKQESSFFIGTDSGIFYVHGDEVDSGILESLLEIYQQSVRHKTRFTLFSSSVKWDQEIKNVFGNKISRHPRYTFTFNQQNYMTHESLFPENLTIRKIDAAFVKQSLHFNEEYNTEYWGSTSNFLKNGLGFCIVHNEDVISECTSIFSSNQYAEIDIATKPNWMGQGLALAVAHAFIDECLANHITPRWDCNVDNAASIKLGKKLGFEKPKLYCVFA